MKISGRFVRDLVKKRIMKDKVHILISLRSDPGSMNRDTERSKEIISAMHRNGFITKNGSKGYIHYKNEDQGIKKIDFKFEYPDEALEFLKTLNTECNTYVKNSESCENDCGKLNRSPALTARNVCFQVLTFNRKESV